MKAYISGPLMGARDLSRLRRLYEEFAETCKKTGWSPYLPHQHTDPVAAPHLSDETVVERDLKELTSSNLVLAYLGEPSTGVGAEIAIAIHQGKHVLAAFERSKPVSRFIIGLLQRYPKARICAFTELKEANSWIEEVLRSVMQVGSPADESSSAGRFRIHDTPASIESRVSARSSSVPDVLA